MARALKVRGTDSLILRARDSSNSFYIESGVILSGSGPMSDPFYWFAAGKDVSGGNSNLGAFLFCLA